MNDRRKNPRHWRISVKRKQDLTTKESCYLKSLEPYILIETQETDLAVYYWTSLYSGQGKSKHRVLRLDSFDNIGKDAYVTDDYWEGWKHCMDFCRKDRHVTSAHGVCFIPLKELVSNVQLPEEVIDCEELRNLWNIEMINEVLIRVKK